MKLHKDGTLEGTPQEIAEYMKLKDPMFGKCMVPLDKKSEQNFLTAEDLYELGGIIMRMK